MKENCVISFKVKDVAAKLLQFHLKSALYHLGNRTYCEVKILGVSPNRDNYEVLTSRNDSAIWCKIRRCKDNCLVLRLVVSLQII